MKDALGELHPSRNVARRMHELETELQRARMQRRRQSKSPETLGRWGLEQPAEPQQEEGWFVTYLDMMTLLLVVMIVMLAFSGSLNERPGRNVDTNATAAATGDAEPSVTRDAMSVATTGATSAAVPAGIPVAQDPTPVVPAAAPSAPEAPTLARAAAPAAGGEADASDDAGAGTGPAATPAATTGAPVSDAVPPGDTQRTTTTPTTQPTEQPTPATPATEPTQPTPPTSPTSPTPAMPNVAGTGPLPGGSGLLPGGDGLLPGADGSTELLYPGWSAADFAASFIGPPRPASPNASDQDGSLGTEEEGALFALAEAPEGSAPEGTVAAASPDAPADAPVVPQGPSEGEALAAGLSLGDLGGDVEVVVNERSVSFRVNSEILFDSSQADLSRSGLSVLRRIVDVLSKTNHEVTVEGHTDAVAVRRNVRFPSNWELSSARAGSVVRYLQANGIDGARLKAVGYADTRPIGNNHTPEGRARNRRVELIIEKRD